MASQDMIQDMILEKSLGIDEASRTKKRGKAGLILVGVSGALLAGLYAVATPFILPALRKVCLPFVPATTVQIENVLKALKGRSGTLIDIGSGDGRIVLEAAKNGFQSVGVELNPWLVWYSKLTARLRGLGNHASFYRQDLWKMRTHPFQNVVIFGVPQMMSPLADKLLTELNSDSRVVACRFPFPHWVPHQTIGEGVDMVWVYNMDTLVTINGLDGLDG
ncbi:ATP synthase subunit C lysine N-methyltransferase-like [Ptychodera flava]|uniref:ATP synthase subunit C lysine N-methyltransferase-like n=1 Tax=Ptychodera flava TaxID=63121 RepID=UPI00396A34B2